MKTAKRRPQAKTRVRKPTRALKVAKKPVSASRHPSTALAVARPNAKPWLITSDEVTILKNSVCKGASDEELKFCLAVARRYELDPFQRQIWFVPRWDSTAERTDGQQGGKVFVPVVGIDGMLHLAARDHKDFGSYSEPEFGPMHEVTFIKNNKGSVQKMQAPEWCRIECWKKGDTHPTVGKVWWDEIYPNVNFAPLVRQMPRLMLAKCAKAQATRTAYPKTGGLYIPEEMQPAGPPDVTPGGRLMTYTQAAPMVSEYFCPTHQCDISKCPAHEHTQAENDAMIDLERRRKYTPAQREIVDRKTNSAVPRPSAEADDALGVPQSWQRPGEPKHLLEYVWFDESQTARIDEPKFPIMADFKAILKKLVKQGRVAPNGEELEALKWECQKRGIELRRRYEKREPGE